MATSRFDPADLDTVGVFSRWIQNARHSRGLNARRSRRLATARHQGSRSKTKTDTISLS
jgi:hypothetical protein